VIAHNQPTLGYREIEAAKRVIKNGWLAQGQEVRSFEDELCDFFGLPKEHVVLVSSGSAALFLALWVLNLKDSNVGIPVYSCSSLRNATEMLGAKPIYFDCCDESPNLDMDTVQTSDMDALIATSMFGLPIDIKNNGFKVIEDISQAFGAEENGIPIGLRGILGVCSFYATKLITSGGQGGAIISKDKNLIDAIRDYREFDNRRDNNIRFNFQMSDLNAAVGRVQLKQFEKFKNRRADIFNMYKDYGFNMMDSKSEKYVPIRYRAILNTNQPNKIINELNKAGISAIVPIEKDELLSDPILFKNASLLTSKTVSLPIYPNLEHSIVKKIGNCVSENI
jgi:perosamine synthetase